MAGPVTFTIRSLDGVQVSGAVGEGSLRRMYETGTGGVLATQFCSGIGGDKNDLSILLPMNLDVATLDALKDVLQDFVAKGWQDTCESEGHQAYKARVTHEIAPGPFLAALDFLQVPNDPVFETVAAKWKYQATSQLEAIGKDLVTQFLEPALLGNMDFGPYSRTLVVFQHKVASVRQHEDYAMDPQHSLTQCAKTTKDANLLVFGSVQEKRPRCKGAKYYRMYEGANGCLDIDRSLHLQKVLVEKEVQWEDPFDTLVAELFKGSFQRAIFRDVIAASLAFKGIGVEIVDGADAVLLCAPWVA
jgi:hypothetical protein